jgi:hypothetical protein
VCTTQAERVYRAVRAECLAIDQVNPSVWLISTLHLMMLTDSPLCRKCGADDETPAHILCRCEALASLRHAYLGSFLEQEDIKGISLGANCRFSKAAGLP